MFFDFLMVSPGGNNDRMVLGGIGSVYTRMGNQRLHASMGGAHASIAPLRQFTQVHASVPSVGGQGVTLTRSSVCVPPVHACIVGSNRAWQRSLLARAWLEEAWFGPKVQRVGFFHQSPTASPLAAGQKCVYESSKSERSARIADV